MEKKYVLQGLSAQREKDFPNLVNQGKMLLASLLCLFIMPFNQNFFGVILLVAVINISIISLVFIKQCKKKQILRYKINKFDSELKIFFIEFNTVLKKQKGNENTEVKELLNKILLYHEVKKITYSYSSDPIVKSKTKVSISEDLTDTNIIKIYTEILNYIIIDYIKATNYTPKTFSEIELYKISKDLVSYVFYKKKYK